MLKTEQAKRMVDEGLEQLSAALEQGHSEALQEYLGTMARFHRYSLGNLMLILLQCPHATQVAGYYRWKTLGRHVKAGEKGILILAPVRGPVPSRSPRAEANPEDPEPAVESIVAFRAAQVFDVSQTDGAPLPQFATATGDPGEHTERLRGLLRHLNIDLEYSEDLLTAEGLSRGGVITLRPGLDPAQEFSVLVHELAHELLHQTQKGSTRPPRSTRELEAEAVAYVVSEAVGLDTQGASSDYIQLYRGDAKTLTESLESIRRVSNRILAALLQPDR